MERKKDMDVSSLTSPIQTHPQALGNPAHPTLEMLSRFAPESADPILKFIGEVSPEIKAVSEIYSSRKNPPTDETGLISTHNPLEKHSSYQSPAALSGTYSGGGPGADFTYTPSKEKTPGQGSSTSTAPSSVSVLV